MIYAEVHIYSIVIMRPYVSLICATNGISRSENSYNKFDVTFSNFCIPFLPSPFSFNMACSKFFSGDLPELLNEVLQYFHYDYKTLHSCILVNRLWCRLAIPLLWEDPFSIPTLNCRFIDIYLSYLNEDWKLKLNEYGINNNLFPSNTFFNYPSFIQ